MELISFRSDPPLEIPDHLKLTAEPTAVVLPDGALVWVRVIPLALGDEPQRAMERLEHLATVSGGSLLRPLAARVDGRRLVVAEEVPDGVSLQTLQRVVPFTWEQASMVGEGLLVAVAALEARQASHGGIGPDTVYLSDVDGRVRVAVPDPRPAQPGRPTDLETAAALARGLLEGSSEPSRRVVPALTQDRLLNLVDLPAPAHRQAARVAAGWRRALDTHLGSVGKARVRRQLQALAGRLRQQQAIAGRPVHPPAPAPAPSTPGPAAVDLEQRAEGSGAGGSLVPSSTAAIGSAGHTAGRPGREAEAGPLPPIPEGSNERPRLAPSRATAWSPARARHRGWLAAGALLLLIFVGAGTTLALSHRGGSRTVRPTPGSSAPTTPAATPPATPTPSAPATPTPTPSPTAAPLEVPLLAPTSNPPITGVQLTASCPPSGSGACTFTIAANLGTHPVDTVDWQLDLVNRCTGSVSEVASGQIPAPASYTYVEAQPQLSVPSTTPVGLVALAGAPNSAASAPILITPPGSACPG
ncbi:MAG: serine/threonine-protein kinase [Candidatus Dormibacteria bacterium]